MDVLLQASIHPGASVHEQLPVNKNCSMFSSAICKARVIFLASALPLAAVDSIVITDNIPTTRMTMEMRTSMRVRPEELFILLYDISLPDRRFGCRRFESY